MYFTMKKMTYMSLIGLSLTLTGCQSQTLQLINHSSESPSQTIETGTVNQTGNDSKIRASEFQLTAQAKPSENYIRLDWTNLSNTTYKVYQRPEGSSEFNPISMTNFENQDPVKVLNIYPSQGVPYKDVHQDDLAYSPEKQSALLKDWIKDYGLGKIEVETVNVDAFGSHPDRYLKDSNGNYKYDVLAIGFWNINHESMFLSDQGVQAVADFIEYGGGVLAGHHHLGVFQLDRGLNRIKDLFGVKFVIENGTLGLHSAPLRDTELANIDYVAPDISEAVHTSRYWYGSEKVKIEKKGLLTQYPWDIETENLMLDIPYSHNGHEFVTGDVWLSFVPGTAHNSPNGTPVKELTQLPDGTTGTKGAYLSTYKNTALIQTGHNSIVNHDTALEATEDEKKILVNTLFYLNQLSDDNYLNDHSGRDLANPIISKADQTLNGSSFQLTLTATDQGSTYEYYVEAQPKDGSAKLTSNTVTETITTGIKGYSYVLDTNPTTEPDLIVNATSNVITGQLTSDAMYLHIKAIDGAGNTSDTMHIRLEKSSTPTPMPQDVELTTQAKPSENYIRLDWTNVPDSTYRVYQRPEGADEFQSISMTDLSKREPIKVLNIYPTYAIPEKEDGSLDIAGKRKTKSAILEDWIADYGLGLIQVDSLNKEDFENNPNKWLKHSDGSYKYDVIVVGFWNIEFSTHHIYSDGIAAISEFIDNGGGVLAGHQHIGYHGFNQGLNTIKQKFGVKLIKEQGAIESHLGNIDYVLPEVSVHDESSYYWTMGSKVVAAKSGLLLNYPYEISQKGRIFNIPLSHDTWEFYTGDVWLQYHEPVSHVLTVIPYPPAKDISELPDGTKGTSNGYLHTYNNTAIIQTGHTSYNGELTATEDEKKILVNTLFYLNQLSSDNYLNDHSGQDVAKPVISKVDQVIDRNNFELTLTAMDQGSTYEYYVEAQPKDGSAKLTSNTVTETITTGINGYSYVLDSNPTTEPDDVIDTTSNVITGQLSSDEMYLHIKTIDGAGNVSETLHIKLEKEDVPLPTDIELTAQSNPLENMIRLDWTDAYGTTYQVYQRQEGVNNFQPIGTVNFDSNEQVRVLNIYPDNNTDIIDFYKTWDGETVLLPRGASLKRWMEEPNAEHSKGYGQGLIKVTPVTFNEFNSNPSKTLTKDSEGEWNYDVVFIGSWHCNGDCYNNSSFNSTTTGYLQSFLDSGRGVLIGHDFTSFRERLVTDNLNYGPTAVGSNLIQITKQGVMTNFPWNLGDVGTVLDIKPTHNNGNFVQGDVDVWVKFEDLQNPSRCEQWCSAEELRSNGETNNHYLVTKNNLGMIQTGHSEGQATLDEQKILANTLFYLKQVSEVNYLNDHSGRDLASPVISKVDQTVSGSSFELTLTAMDQGSTYDYYVEAQPKNGSAKLTSNTVTETITTGIKGYSYVLDTNPTTEPDLIVNATSNVITGQLTSDAMYLHIKAIDGAGNTSDTMHIRLEKSSTPTPTPQDLELTAQAKPSENYIRLDWTEMSDSTYKVFQKKEGASEFQSIGAMNFNGDEPVKVLNVYPRSGTIVSYTTWDGEWFEVDHSGLLKMWMEVPNDEHPKGYGQGLIDVTPVKFPDFNANPGNYLYKTDTGEWNYDVIYVGSWDCNGNCAFNQQTFSSETTQYVSEFVNDGYGFLIGHDFNSFRENLVLSNENDANQSVSSTEVRLEKKGILTSYPWYLGEIGSLLTVPFTHNNGNFTNADIWIKFNNITTPGYCKNWCNPEMYEGDATNNHYLVTKNNLGMIQTGHSNGRATSDEQKILANTLFYLKQLTSNNYLDDYSGQDVKVPETPSIKQTQVLSNDFLEITFNPFIDQGSTYEYYVTATPKDGSSTLTSNVVSETITSGVAGVSYVIDTNPDTEPDHQIDALSNNKLTVQPNHQKTTYLHLKVIDRAGNASETLHYSISIPKINTAEQRDDQIYVNWDIEIPESSIFFKQDFETLQMDYSVSPVIENGAYTMQNGVYYDPYGASRPLNDPVRNSLKIGSGYGINGSNGLRLNQTTSGQGWNYTYYPTRPQPNGGSDDSDVKYDGWIQLRGGKPLIGRFESIGSGLIETSVDPGYWSGGSINDSSLTWAETLSANEFLNRLNTKTAIKINNPTNKSENPYFLTTALDTTYSYNYLLAQGYTEERNGQWYFVPSEKPYAWTDYVRPSQTVTPDANRQVESIQAGKPLYRLQSQEVGHGDVEVNSNQWTSYSFNLNVPDTTTIRDLDYWFLVRQVLSTDDSLQLDNLQVAYAPKSRLYRDGKLIYENYSVEYTDGDVQDLAAPEKVIVSADYINGNLQLTWQAVKDKGTLYTYEVSGVDENGMESLRSEPKTVEFISGVKEYHIYLNGSLIETTPDLSYQFDQPITPSDRIEVGVVDQAGNESKTQLNFLNLTAQAKPSDNMIRLDWTKVNESTYQVYQKKEGSDEFQSISMTDLSKGKQVQVLNIYPYNEDPEKGFLTLKTTTFTTWDGETLTLPTSASLKQWMEEPNDEHPQGYGQGLIEVTPVSIDEFNANPSHYLIKNEDDWNYDVVMIGSWDNNATNDLNESSMTLLKQFIQDRRGVLFGHDTLVYGRKYLSQFANDVNITYRGDTLFNGVNEKGGPVNGESTIQITKSGLLTNYPWKIGDLNKKLQVPATHVYNQHANGDIWLRFNYNDIGMDNPNNVYLTTYNNCAMVQTGHSNGQATPDEQKILANTLFYLNQLSEANYLNDYSGQDVKGPKTPSIKLTQSTTDGFVELTFNPFVDQGSTYEYYVKASPKNGESNAISPIVSETITTGVAGVSYVIDTNPKTEPDDQLDVLTNNKLKVKLSETQTSYVHLKVIDQAGNSSETVHIPISAPPVLRSEVIDNRYIRLDWTTPLLPENILWESSFEPNDTRPMISYNGKLGNQSIDSSTSFSGNSSLKVGDALKGKPNYYDPTKGVFVDVTQFDRVKNVFTDQMPVSIQIKAKASRKNDNAYLTLLVAGGREFKLTDVGVTVAEFTPTGSTRIKLNNPNSFGFESPYDLIDTSNQDSYIWGGDLSSTSHYLDLNPQMHLTSGVDSDGYLHLRSPLTRDLQAGESIKVRRWVDPIDEFKKPIASTEWETIQYNTTITDMAYLDMFTLGCFFNIKTFTEGQDVYLDDLSISTPVKVKLYRDEQLIYEGFANQLDDLEATDKVAPEGIDLTTANLTATSNENNSSEYTFNFEFKRPTDQGSTYQYQIASVNAYGMESLKSKPTSETVTSGIAGYSYLIDTHPTTDPDPIIDLAADQRQISYTGSGTHYLHIKVIDEAGNASETQHIKLAGLELTAEAKPSDNLIRLDWTDLNESTYQVYQKKEGATEFQSIGATDFESTEQIKVLNVYPNPVTFEVGSVDNVMETYQTWDGETVTLPKAASLKRWMEEPNAESPKGYGKGLIEVTAVGFDVFNANPQSVLNQNDLGEWNYDVVFVGSWDCNGSCTNEVGFFNTPTTDYLRTFIESGRGLLVGHDFASFREQLVTSNVNDASKTIASNQIRITQKGVMTNYPWDLGEVGTILDIPTTHNNGNFIRGDVDLWMKFEDFQNPSRCFVWCNAEELRSNGETNNHYLITKNNIGVIQTGHSNGEATPDEQKILANTLFYLNQLSAENYLDDHSGQDVKAPVKPSVNKTELLPNGFIELQFNELVDQGSTYEYYVKATHKSGYEQVSNIAKETITTGVAGVSYVIDTNPNTEPDNQTDLFENQSLQIKPNSSQTTYLHIKVIDNAGNSSETLHFSLALINLTAEPRPTENDGKGSVHLEWTDLPDHTYQIFKKEEESEEFQELSTTEAPCLD